MANPELSNVQLVILAVYHLGGERKAVDVEDIAVQSYKLAPQKFAWKKYPEMIDKAVVQYALKDASLPKNGPPLLTGSIKHGYILTLSGLEWVILNENQSNFSDVSNFRSKSNFEKLILERTRLETSLAFRKFTDNELSSITDGDFQDFTRVNEYFPDHARMRRFTIIDNAIQGHSQLESCWKYLQSRFIKGE
jgi:hypothetical protein